MSRGDLAIMDDLIPVVKAEEDLRDRNSQLDAEQIREAVFKVTGDREMADFCSAKRAIQISASKM